MIKGLFSIILCCATALSAIGFAAPSKQTFFDFTGVADKAIPAVVSIQVKMSQPSSPFGLQGADPFNDELFEFFFGRPYRRDQSTPREAPLAVAQGSGFIVSADGYVLTNSHVVRDAKEILVKLNDGRSLEGKLIGHDPNTDVAVLKIEATKLPFLSFGSSADLKVGQWAIAVGNPFGLQESLTVGVVSAVGRANLDVADMEDFIQTDAAINRGNSGGPLLNIDGEVIGINTAIASNTGGYMGVGFAIPSDMAKHVMQELIANGNVTRGFLGVLLQPVDYDLAMAFGLDKVEGALVAEVQAGSPAEKAGIKRGDIIIEHEGRRVTSVSALRNSISLTKPGGKISLKILRDGNLIPATVQIAEFTLSKNGSTIPSSNKGVLGIKVGDISPADARNYGLAPDETGVIVTDVDPSSIATLAGIKKDTIILEVNKQKISSADQFYKAVGSLEKGSKLLMLIRQSRSTGYVVLTIR